MSSNINLVSCKNKKPKHESLSMEPKKSQVPKISTLLYNGYRHLLLRQKHLKSIFGRHKEI